MDEGSILRYLEERNPPLWEVLFWLQVRKNGREKERDRKFDFGFGFVLLASAIVD
jgi:hypothetical protein